MSPMRQRRLLGKQPIPVRGSLRVRTLYRGHVVEQYRNRNIFLNVGREWLIQLMSFGAYPVTVGDPPPPVANERRIAFMGVGVGGREQTMQAAADALYFPVHNPLHATFTQDDTDVTITGLESPLLWAPGRYAKPIHQVKYSAPVGTPPHSVWVRWTALWSAGEINSEYGGADVPITEAAMYPYLDDGGGNVKELTLSDMKVVSSSYEAFGPVTKANPFELEIQWVYRT